MGKGKGVPAIVLRALGGVFVWSRYHFIGRWELSISW
jgi:hypothetical protein